MKKYQIFKDISDAGESFYVYENAQVHGPKKSRCVGAYLADDPELAECMKDGDVCDGFDTRTTKTPDGHSDWVKRLGQWHLSKIDRTDSRTVCGRPMLGNNYASVLPISLREKCPECFGEGGNS